MKKALALLLALLTCLSLCACGGAGSASSPAADSAAVAEAPQAAAPEPMPVEEVQMMSDAGMGFANTAAGEDRAAGNNSPDVDPEKIIYSADVTVETTDFDEAVSDVSALIEEYDGWIESSSVNDVDYYSRARGYASSRSASYTLRVPSGSFERLMTGLSRLGNVPYTHTYTENVTAQYYDVQARLTAYTAQETRLLEMMEKAETVEDIISIEEKLTELRYEIESLQSTLNNYDRKVNYSSIYLSLQEVQEYTPEAEVRLTYGQQLVRALSRGFRNAGNFFKNLLIDIAASLPTLIFLAVVVIAAVLAVKKRLAKRKKNAAPAAPEEKEKQ